jgi:hypothetical protein
MCCGNTGTNLLQLMVFLLHVSFILTDIHLRINLCLLSYNQWFTSYGCLYKIAHVKQSVVLHKLNMEEFMFFMKSGRKLAASPYSHGFDCRNTSNYVVPLPFSYRIFNPPSAFSPVVLIDMQVYNLISHI